MQAPPVYPEFERVRTRYLVPALLLLVPAASLSFYSLGLLPAAWQDAAAFHISDVLTLAMLFLFGQHLGGVRLASFFVEVPSTDAYREGVELTILVMIVSIAAFYALYYPLSFVLPGFVEWWVIESPDFIVHTEDGSLPVVPNALVFLSLVISTPILEELAFRGYIMSRLAHKWGLRAGILISSAIFAVLHTDVLGAFLFGIAMCVLYVKTGSLLLPMLCHALNNVLAWTWEFVYIYEEGTEHVYTLEEFQSEWRWAVGFGVAAIVWILLDLRRSEPVMPWRLPTTPARPHPVAQRDPRPPVADSSA